MSIHPLARYRTTRKEREILDRMLYIAGGDSMRLRQAMLDTQGPDGVSRLEDVAIRLLEVQGIDVPLELRAIADSEAEHG